MSYQVLARKWRPKRFAELVGQEHVVRALTNALDTGRVHHAFLFTGTRGVGKTTIARIFAKSLNCERGTSSDPCGLCTVCTEIDVGRFVDLLEIDAASNTGVDDVREVIENAQYAPARGRFKVYLVDEVHMLSKNAFNALLKTLEEPPPHVKFLLATTDPQKLPVTVLSRCLKFNLKRLLPEQIGGQMRHILEAEKVQFEPVALTELARAADGSLRDGLSLLDQAIAYGAGVVRATEVRSMLGTIERARVARLLEAVCAGDGVALMDEIVQLVEFAPDFAAVLDELAVLLHRVQLRQLVPGHQTGDTEDEASIARFASSLAPEGVQLYYQLTIASRRDLPLAPTPRAGFEMALLRLLAFRPDELKPTPVTGAASGPSTPRREPTVNAAPASAISPKIVESGPIIGEIPRNSPIDMNMSLIVEDWSRLIERAGLRGPSGQLASHAALLGIDGRTLRLALKPEHEHLNMPFLVPQMEERLAAVLGTGVRVRFEKAVAGLDTPADQAARQRDDRQREAERALEDDPVVQGLVRDLGARTVPNSVRAVD